MVTKKFKYQKYLFLIVGLIVVFFHCMPVYAKEQQDDGKAVIFLLDVSGSMKTNDPGRLAVDSMAQMVYALPSDYRVGFVAYSTEVVVQQDLAESSHRNEIMSVFEKVEYKGYSNAGAGLLCAVDMLEEDAAREKSIIMLSDGELLMGEEAETESSASSYQEALEQAKELGIVIHVIGLGDEMEDMDNAIFNAAFETGGKGYRITQATEIQNAIDSILIEELGIKWSTIAIVDADGGMEEVVAELPYLYADKIRVLLTSSHPIQNLKTNFQAESAKQINGARYSLLEIEKPSGGQLELSFEGTEGSQVRINVIPEYYVIPKAEVSYEDRLPNTDDTTETLYYDRTAKIVYTFYNAEASVQLWNSEYFNHNIIISSANEEFEELILNAGALEMTEKVTDSCEYEVKFDFTELPVNVIGADGVQVRLEAPSPVPVEEPKPPYLLIGAAILGFLVVALIAILLYLNRRKPVKVPEEERPEPGRHHYVGKINIYITRTRSGYDIPPLTYNLFRLPQGKVISLQEILQECEVQEEFQGAADIYFKAGADRSLILTNNSDCTIIKNREILMKKKSYQLSMDSKVDVAFEDEISELAFQYKDLKPSEMR